MKRLQRNGFAGRPSLVTVLLFVLALAVPVFGDPPTESETRLLNDIKYLASDELEGRGIGTKGLDLAADFIKQEFAKAGVDVSLVAGSPFQTFQMVTGSELGTPNTLEFAGPEGKTIGLKYDADFRTCSFGGSGSFDGGVVFCGYGIQDKKYTDFEGIDVKGKVVIVMRRVPQQGNPKAPFGGARGGMSLHAALPVKVSTVSGKGAAAILLVNDPYTSRTEPEKADKRIEQAAKAVESAKKELDAVDPQDSAKSAEAKKKLSQATARLEAQRKAKENLKTDPLMNFGYGGMGKEQTVPILHITQKACNELLTAALNKSLDEIEAEIDKDLKPQSGVLTNWAAKGATTVKRLQADVKNVIGVLPGEGPLAEETIVIGAHYDHLGMGGRGSLSGGKKDVHNGADDNASGTVCLIELARRLAARKEKLPRRVAFIAFTAEERGLVGSARYAKEPVFPLEKTIAMFNMDMVGRLKDDKLMVMGIGTAPRWKGLIEKLGKEHGFKLTLKPEGIGPSDHSSFYRKKIPVLHFFTGIHADYHKPSDDWDKINVNGMSRVVDLVEEAVVATAGAPERPKYVEIKGSASVRRAGNRPYFGIMPEFGNDTPGCGVSGVAPDSPAGKGGVKGGDRIVQFASNKINNLSDLDLALRKSKAGDTVDVVVMRQGKQVKLQVTLGKPR